MAILSVLVSGQVSVMVIDLFKMIDIKKNTTEYRFSLLFQGWKGGVNIIPVVQTGQRVAPGQLLGFAVRITLAKARLNGWR